MWSWIGYGQIRNRFSKKENSVGLTKVRNDIQEQLTKANFIVDEDMTFTSFKDNEFDFAIVRHCLEYSPIPYLTLLEYNRIQNHGMYIEMHVVIEN